MRHSDLGPPAHDPKEFQLGIVYVCSHVAPSSRHSTSSVHLRRDTGKSLHLIIRQQPLSFRARIHNACPLTIAAAPFHSCPSGLPNATLIYSNLHLRALACPPTISAVPFCHGKHHSCSHNPLFSIPPVIALPPRRPTLYKRPSHSAPQRTLLIQPPTLAWAFILLY